jgi:hypothetical protein
MAPARRISDASLGKIPTTSVRLCPLALALIGTALLFAAELAAIPFAAQSQSDTGPAIVDSVFGVATILTAIGMLLAGKATLQAGLWRDWRRFTPLVVGLWSLVLIGVTFTHAAWAGIAVYGLCFLALYTRPSPVATALRRPKCKGPDWRSSRHPHRPIRRGEAAGVSADCPARLGTQRVECLNPHESPAIESAFDAVSGVGEVGKRSVGGT